MVQASQEGLVVIGPVNQECVKCFGIGHVVEDAVGGLVVGTVVGRLGFGGG